MITREQLKERFDDSWIPEPYSGCHLWTGCTAGIGYGVIAMRPRNTIAHRLSFEIHKGKIPKGMSVCHKCDTPLCVNPDHLFLGTQKDNLRDMNRKGRRWGNIKLTQSQVNEIRSSTDTQENLAKRFGVRQSNISRIKAWKRWTIDGMAQRASAKKGGLGRK